MMCAQSDSRKRAASESLLGEPSPLCDAKRKPLDHSDSCIGANSEEKARKVSVHATILDPVLLQRAGIQVDPVTNQVYEYASSLQPLERFGLHSRTGTINRLTPCEIKEAGELFMQNGFVLLHDFVSNGVCELMKQTLEILMDNIRKVDTQQIGIRAQKRYTVSDTQKSSSLLHEPGFIEALNELYEKGLSDLLHEIFQSDPRLFNAGAQVVLEGTTQYQYLHADTPHVFAPGYHLFAGMPAGYKVQQATPPTNDNGSDEEAATKVARGALPLRWLQKLPEAVDVNIVLDDWTWESGAPRILPGRHFYEMIAHPQVNFSEAAYPNNLREEMILFDSVRSQSTDDGLSEVQETKAAETSSGLQWWPTSCSSLRSQLFPLRRGTVIIRDVNTLHGGAPNLSARQRHMPSFIFEPREWTDMRNTMLSNRDWDWLPRFWGWPQVMPEQVQLLNSEFARDSAHLLPSTDATEDGETFVWSTGGSWRWLHEVFGFDKERLQSMVSQRAATFHKYKRRDETYNHDTWVREDLGQKVLKKSV